MRVLAITAMYPSPTRPAWGTFVKSQVESLRAAGLDVEVLVLEGRPRKLIYPRGILQLRRRIAAGSFDLVHAHFSYVGMVARTQWTLPVVVTYHGDDLLGTRTPDGKISSFSKIMVRAGQVLANSVDAAIVQSTQMAAKLSRPDVYVIPHEVDLELFKPLDRQSARRTLGLDPDKKYLLFAANPRIPVKRFPLARAAADLLAAHDPSVELLVVHKEPQERLPLYMSAADALVFPSYQEGSPNIVKQAMACNLPMVSTDVGDVQEIIGDTEGCYICEPDAASLAARLGEILRCGGRTLGREHVRHLDGPSVARRVIQVYQNVLERKSQAARTAQRAA
jgi:glycosyltransferase involved in cell wall biosynthesis